MKEDKRGLSEALEFKRGCEQLGIVLNAGVERKYVLCLRVPQAVVKPLELVCLCSCVTEVLGKT